MASCQPIRYFTHIESQDQEARQREVNSKLSELRQTIRIIDEAEPQRMPEGNAAPALVASFALAAFGYIGRSYFTNSPMAKAISTVSMTTGCIGLFMLFLQVIQGMTQDNSGSRAYKEALVQLNEYKAALA